MAEQIILAEHGGARNRKLRNLKSAFASGVEYVIPCKQHPFFVPQFPQA